MSNRVEPESVGLSPSAWLSVHGQLIGYTSGAADDLDMADALAKRIEEVPGFEIDERRRGYFGGYCETCKANVTAKKKDRASIMKLASGKCPVCGSEGIEEPLPIYIKLDKAERIFAWDAVKKMLKGNGQTPALRRQIKVIAEEFGKLDDFEALAHPAPKKETNDAGDPAAK
jgi:hypothetical protein